VIQLVKSHMMKKITKYQNFIQLLKHNMKPLKLRCKDTVKKLPGIIQPKKGKRKQYKRNKQIENENN